MLISITFFILYILIIGTLLIVGLLPTRSNSRIDNSETLKLSQLTVIIPFRNEKENLPFLISSINRQSIQPVQFIFVNDHSDDDGPSLLLSHKNEKFRCIDLPKDVKGKKRAIRFAIDFVKTEYVLTLDADVELSEHYFSKIEKLPISDMWILPVHMKGDSFLQLMSSIDIVLVNAINEGISRVSRPVLASGANLLFKVKVFQEVSTTTNLEVSSGDDIFLLKDFRDAGKEIQLNSDKELAVTTMAPKSLKELLSQRVRWISKSSRVKDKLSLGLVITQLVFTLGLT